MTLLELLSLLRKHLKLVIILPILIAVVAGVGSMFMADEYTATTSMYVLSQSDEEYTSSSSTYSDLSASQMIANDVATLAESATLAEDVALGLGLENIDAYSVSVESSTSTRIITLSVTGVDAEMAASIANAYVQNVASSAQSVMDVESVNVIDQATVPENPSGPNRVLYVAVAFLAGLFLAVCIIVIADMVNVKVRTDDDINDLLGLPVVGHFPDVE